MIEWFTWVQFALGIAAGLLCLGMAFANRKPGDLTVGAVLLIELLLVVQLFMAIVGPAAGNPIVGDALEYWMYLIAALLLPPLSAFWALIERVRWSNAVLAVAAFAVAVMVVRMQQIWVG